MKDYSIWLKQRHKKTFNEENRKGSFTLPMSPQSQAWAIQCGERYPLLLGRVSEVNTQLYHSTRPVPVAPPGEPSTGLGPSTWAQASGPSQGQTGQCSPSFQAGPCGPRIQARHSSPRHQAHSGDPDSDPS